MVGRFLSACFAGSLLLALLSPHGLATHSSGFTRDEGVRAGSGVSVEVLRLADGTIRLYVTDLGGPVYTSEDGLTFTQVDGAITPGSDPAIVELEDGTYRLYYAMAIGPQGPTQTKELRSATSTDGLTFTEESGVRYADLGFGVPEVVALPEGGYRLYYVDRGNNGESIVASATSTDGMEFTFEQGDLLPEGYVDPAVEYIGDGQWLMVTSTFPTGVAEEGFTQDLYLAVSDDGVSWDLDTQALRDDPDVNSLDPALLKLDDDTWRVYYSESPAGSLGGPFEVVSGVLDIPANHSRTLTLTLRKHLTAKGSLDAAGDMDACIASIAVKVQRKVGDSWKTIATETTSAAGAYSAAVPDKAGKYRAKVVASSTGLVACGKSTSDTKRHTH